ncbi:hypothetical protein EB810_00725 [Altererythrobacter sp. FM1]|uniref:Lipoprotein n=1 Tax=Tsuneonella flava TaxID=2055955 RepID=A0ABX7KDZ3_9SPHN|nr:hypothetical protein [Tsuneonella flava]QSB44800.1 hypothetical protein IDJ81_01055 [Tsuneonella flava]ROT96523.1 hypothetical protein EB810_00725 [Altererythrobacter sp. FM1]
MTLKPALFALPLLALLAACGEKQSAASNEERQTAVGEILPGSISDEMLPLDEVKSQSPPLKESPSDKGSARAGSDTASGAAADSGASPTPSATPSAKPSASAAPEPSISLGNPAATQD